MLGLKAQAFIMLVAASSVLASCQQKTDESRIYFVARKVPGANIFSVSMKQDLIRLTNNSGSRDTDMTLDKEGNIYFTSNRILAEDRAERAKIGKHGDRRQDLNVFILPAGEVEEKINSAAKPIEKTPMPESLAVVSSDGKQFSFVRTVLPEASARSSRAQIESQTHDELYWMQGPNSEATKIYQDGVIIKPDWSADSKQLVFSSYDYDNKVAKLLRFDIATGKVDVLLENPFGQNQIDSAQWSPDVKAISLILHPYGDKKLRTLYLYKLADQSLHVISGEHHSVDPYVSWAKDGNKIVYSAAVDKGDLAVMSRRPSEDTQVHIFSTDLKGGVKQISQGQGVFSSPELSPDNKRIAYKYTDNYRARKAQLKVMDLEGKELATLHDKVFRRVPLIWQ